MDDDNPGTGFLYCMSGSYYRSPENGGAGTSSVDAGRPLRTDRIALCLQ